jgi:hypothetical protein
MHLLAQAGPSITLNEFDLAVEALPRKVRASTAMIYNRMPLEHWKVFFNSSSFGHHINHMIFF